MLRKSWVPLDEVLRELGERLATIDKPDYITFSGSGEPTLSSDLGRAIRSVKSMTDAPVCVITNGTLLWMEDVRRDLMEADAVMPSLDSAVQETFDRICRPHHGLRVDRIIEGLVSFRDVFKGSLWLEILFMKGYNDTQSELDAFAQAVERIRPDQIHLNTVVRPPADANVEPVSKTWLETVRDRLGPRAVVIASFDRPDRADRETTADEVREYLKRRPGTSDAIAASLQANCTVIESLLQQLASSGDVRYVEFQGKQYWERVRQ